MKFTKGKYEYELIKMDNGNYRLCTDGVCIATIDEKAIAKLIMPEEDKDEV